jgi:TetR/AcrR family transcriptional regulator, transcriptional repressor for nem operon
LVNVSPFVSDPSKRDALVSAASSLIHLRGYEGTTLARVADAAKVPLGNVYYYFRTKDALAAAVLASREQELAQLFALLEREHLHPRDRICGFVSAFADSAESVAKHGCPYGGLTNELSKREGALGKQAALLFDVQIAWLTAQFVLGAEPTPQASERAKTLVCDIQGACVLSLAMRDPDFFRKRLHTIVRDLHQSTE